MFISIDIGTSYSSVCLLNQEGKSEPIEISTGISIYGGKYSLPSAVFVDDNGKILVGQAAMNSWKRMPQNFRVEFKRDVGQSIPIVLGSRNFLPEDLYAELIRHMKKCAEKWGMEEVEKAYITYPASFGKAKREKIELAARKAGLFDIELVDEPTAAAMCYGEKGTLKDGDILLVYDFGGGTFDVAILRYENGEYESLVPAEGIEHCGGIDIDRMIYSDIYSKIAPALLQPLLTNKANRLRFEGKLAELAVKIKHHLSTAEYADEDIEVGFNTVNYRLGCNDLEKMAAELVAKTIDCCRNILGSAGITVSELDGILLIGGTSRMPLVQKMVREFAGDTLVHTDVDPDLAVVQGALSVKTENADMQYRLGLQYEQGTGGVQDYTKAAECYAKAAEQGYAAAQAKLGVCYYTGNGVDQSYREAVKWYKKAARQGDVDAQYKLGDCYLYGRGVKKNYPEAEKWYQKAAEQGYSLAQYKLGSCYYRDWCYTEAEKWYQKAAEQGYSPAQYKLGSFYYLKKNYSEAVKWYRKSAEQGNAYAQYKLGVCYSYGHGVEEDYSEAIKWYRKAAEQGYVDAQRDLGHCYEYGVGVEKDHSEAEKWYGKAAEQGDYVAYSLL